MTTHIEPDGTLTSATPTGDVSGTSIVSHQAGSPSSDAQQSPAVDAHPDDLAVDRFATAMKAKLAKKRADGRGGWEGPDCSGVILSRLLREHVEKGDMRDVLNLAAMVYVREIADMRPNA